MPNIRAGCLIPLAARVPVYWNLFRQMLFVPFSNYIYFKCIISLVCVSVYWVSVFLCSSYTGHIALAKWKIVESAHSFPLRGTRFSRWPTYDERKILKFSTRNVGKIRASWMELRMRIWVRVPVKLWVQMQIHIIPCQCVCVFKCVCLKVHYTLCSHLYVWCFVLWIVSSYTRQWSNKNWIESVLCLKYCVHIFGPMPGI